MRHREILPIEEQARTTKQKAMDNAVKNPIGRPRNTVRRYTKSYLLSEDEENKMNEFFNQLKKQREQTA